MAHFRVLLLLLLISSVYCCTNAVKYTKPSCGGSSSSTNTQLLTPANPPRECVYHIKASSKHVTQLRVDFAWTLAEPSLPTAPESTQSYVQCVNDYFQVGDIRLCGVETKQHIYVPLNRTAGVTTIDLSLVLAARGGANDLPTPSWDIKVTQLEDDGGFYVAPPGCLQYFPQASGVVTTFNYNRDLGIYPGNMEYAICFRRQASTQELVLKALVFNIGSKDRSSNKLLELDGNCYSPERSSADESEDYLMIPDATAEKLNVRATYYCGNSIDGDTVRSTNPGPLMILFNSDTHFNNQPIAGFYLTYKLV